MLTISLSAKVLYITLARKDEAAGNSEPPQGLPASKPVEGLRTFVDGCVRRILRMNVCGMGMFVSSLQAESPKMNCQP